MAYKKLIKVSNVCQVLDKSKYYKTLTINGVTFTNNGDGTITVNGTATNDAYYTIIPLGDTLYLSHKYLLTGENPGFYLFVENRDKDNKLLPQLKYNNISSLPTNTKKSTFECYIEAGRVCDNLVFKPQLFDLTEMYGAGHEPTTVEQFRQDFPNDLYDYSPRCWLTSYKRVFMTGEGNYLTSYESNLTCKTKNLFNPLGREDAKPIGNWPITKYDVGNVIYRGFAYSGYYQLDETYKCDVTVSGTVINAVQKIRNYGIGYIVKCNPDTVYTLSYETNFNVIVSIFLDLEGNKLGDSWSRTFTTPNNAYYLLVSLASNTEGTYFIENLQLELGNTATGYVPYGHL